MIPKLFPQKKYEIVIESKKAVYTTSMGQNGKLQSYTFSDFKKYKTFETNHLLAVLLFKSFSKIFLYFALYKLYFF